MEKDENVEMVEESEKLELEVKELDESKKEKINKIVKVGLKVAGVVTVGLICYILGSKSKSNDILEVDYTINDTNDNNNDNNEENC